MASNNMKKDFQKVVKMFRDTLPDYMGGRWTGSGWVYDKPCRPEFPKAMMTEQQMRKGTATINLGYAKEEKAKELAESLTTFPPFQTWCESYGAKVERTELNPDNRWQIRITC